MLSPGSAQRVAKPRPPSGAELLRDARGVERRGRVSEAIRHYEMAIAAAERLGEESVLAEALRHLAVARYQQGDSARARQECRRSYALARAVGDPLLAAHALNTLGGLDLSTGCLEEAHGAFVRALELASDCGALRARVEQNLGILANIQGDLDEAMARYRRSLDAYQASNDEHGCAIAYHNLGMVSSDQSLWSEADRCFQKSQVLASRAGDRFLVGLCHVHMAEVDVARQRFDNAHRAAEEALHLFTELGVTNGKSDAHRVLGMVYRDTGRPTQSESRFRTAIELAASSNSVLAEAEASREMALLYQQLGRNQESLQLLHAAHRLFHRLDARIELVHVGGKMLELEETYRAVVREWGRAIELLHPVTHGHSERVARYAVSVARALGLDHQQETAVMLGAYLHDLGKTRVPREILYKAGSLTEAEQQVIRMHPIWGLQLLNDVDFPWALKPIIRWHHERYDGGGYPDGLVGDQIPIEAQIVGIADVFDAMLSRTVDVTGYDERSARKIIAQRRGVWWSELVVDGFLAANPL
jgi:putative nucleotidyltransferase with HDIG domain